MKQNSVSIILPVHNRLELALEAINSAINQRGVEIEIIVIDDGSDKSFNLDRKCGPNISLIRQANRGPAAARNVGIQQARNEFIAFLDSDDLFYPTKLKDQIAGIVRTGADWSCCSYEYWDEVDSLLRTMRIDSFPSRFWRHLCPVGCSSIVARRSALLDIDGFDESFDCAEDWDLLIRLGEMKHPFACPTPLYFYRTHANSMSKKHPEKWQASWERIQTKHGLVLDKPRMYTNCPAIFEDLDLIVESSSAAASNRFAAASLA